ncbi:MAG: hypothetical protein J2P22_00430 [Nocardioides sp.]|nr:hypothetical protein [Nocardioides sp.]
MGTDQFLTDAQSGDQAALSMVWHTSPADEHPPADVTVGEAAVRAIVNAVVAVGHWDTTVSLLNWDDWGGWDDHVVTPNVEHTSDGVQCAHRPRVPLLMFGGPVAPVIDPRWELPRGDHEDRHPAPWPARPRRPTRRRRPRPGRRRRRPPRHPSTAHSTYSLATPRRHRTPTPPPQPLPPPPRTTSIPTPDCALRTRKTLPAPNDVPV